MSDIQLTEHRQDLSRTTAANELLKRAQSLKQQEDEPKERQGGVLGDIAQGVVETPRAILSGARDAAQETIDLVSETSDYIRKTFPSWAKFEKSIGMAPEGQVLIPDVKDPESTTGKMVENVAQFLTGFVGAGKIKALKSISPATKIGKAAKAAAQGGVADFVAFDPLEERLSDLIEEFPALRNPVTDFLDADPSDSAAEGRFKNALEGLGLGVVTDAFGLGVKAIGKARTARIAAQQVDAMPRVADDAFKTLGDPKGALVAKPPKVNPSQVISDPNPETFINFARIDTPDDVKNVMQNMADMFKGDVDKARRGVRAFKEIELDAEQLNAWDILSSRRAGEPLNAEQSVAARNLWAASGRKLTEVAKLAADDPSESNLFMFRKMMGVHKAVQEEVIAARTETARALASWRIPTGGTAEQFRDISDLIEGVGGKDLTREMAQRIAGLAEAGEHGAIDAFIEKGVWARSRDAMLEAWINGLLSGPKTHLVNAISNTTVVFQQMYERGVAAKIGNGVEAGEAIAQFSGLVSGLRDAVRYSAKTFRTGQSGFGLGKVELPRERAISSEAFRMASDTWTGRAVDTMGAAVNLPVRALGAADEFFKTIGYRMELHAQALRMAAGEVNSGKLPKEMLKDRIAEIIEKPPEGIRLAAVDAATYQTFTNTPGPLAKQLSQIAHEYPGVRIVLPFIRTPANIMRYTFERTPIAPLMRHVRADLAAGGARRDLALARISTGTAGLLMTADLAMNGVVTGKGPDDPGEMATLRRAGWQPYSIKVGDRYFAYNRLDPVGMTFGLSAEMVEILRNSDDPDATTEEALIAGVMAIANNAMSKTYLSGMSSVMEAISNPDMHGERWFQRLAGTVVPTGVAEIARIEDPVAREAYTMLDSIRRRTPGMSSDLPPRRDIWGRPISYESGLGSFYDTVSPIYSSKDNPEPVDKELLRLESTVSKPAKKTSFDGATVNLERFPEAYSRYLELAGNELKHPAWGLGAKDLLNKIVSGQHELSPIYQMRSDGPDGGKAEYIQGVVNDYRKMAKDQILREFPEVKAEHDRIQRQRRKLSLGS